MTYREFVLNIATEDVETAVNVAEFLNLGGVFIEDFSDLMDCELVKQIGLVDEDLLARVNEGRAFVHVYLPEHVSEAECRAYLEARLTEEGVAYELICSDIKEEDYANSWKQYYKPLTVGQITVVPSWESYDAKAGEKILLMDPGMAFGTGTHETTSACMETLQKYVTDGCSLLDIGCGSGILSIAALLCGAKDVAALDIDPNAVKIAKENAQLNGFDLCASCDNILEDSYPEKQYDVVVANIVADVIIRFSDKASHFLKKDGTLIVSGIIAPRKDDVVAALERNGFRVLETVEKNGWVCMVAKQ